MSGLTNRVKRGSRGSATLLEAANRILRLLGVSSTKRGKQPSPKSKVTMGLPQLQTCCFIFDLKTGCIIMGSINAFLSFTLLALMIVLAAEVGAIDVEVMYAGDVEMQAGITGLYAMTIILVFMFLVKFIFDIVFVYGVSTERPVIIKAYMIMWIVFFLLSMFIFFLNAPNISVGTICTEVVYIAHNVYTILLCHSFYKQLNTREEV